MVPVAPAFRRCVRLLPCLLLALGCGQANDARPPQSSSDWAPAEYKAFLRDGKQVKTGDATLDYWVGLNLQLCILRRTGDHLGLPQLLRTHAKAIRERPVYGVDPDLVNWANRAAAVVEQQAGLLAQSQDPALYSEMTRRAQQGQSGQPVIDQLDRLVSDWEAERQRVREEGGRLRDALSLRLNRALPPCQF